MISKDIFNTDEDEFDFTNIDFESYEDFLYNPVGVHIDPETRVDVIQNAQVIKTDSWENIVAWINDNFNKLSGKFDISHQGAVLHTITLSS